MDKFVTLILWPGEAVCQFFKVKEGDSRFFLRLYLNLFIYTKITVGLAVLLAVYF